MRRAAAIAMRRRGCARRGSHVTLLPGCARDSGAAAAVGGPESGTLGDLYALDEQVDPPLEYPRGTGHELLARPSAGRESALDLLTVDALVTYAFEAASREPASLAVRATNAMSQLASAARA